MTILVSRKEAVEKGLKRYFTGQACKHGHVAERQVCDWSCTACQAAARKTTYRKAYIRDWQKNNKDKVAERNDRWRKKNDEAVKTRRREWQKENRAKANANTNHYRAQKIKATPVWADHAAIKAIYLEADHQTKMTGIVHHVDHVVPLRGKFVCGLHVENNLTILTSDQNKVKGNRF